MTGTVSVLGYRHLIEPPELGDCGDPECRTVVGAKLVGSAWDFEGFDGVAERERGKDVLLVATYGTATIDTGLDHKAARVCAACDLRRLRVWLADDES